jgi:hypothetical protein
MPCGLFELSVGRHYSQSDKDNGTYLPVWDSWLGGCRRSLAIGGRQIAVDKQCGREDVIVVEERRCLVPCILRGGCSSTASVV